MVLNTRVVLLNQFQICFVINEKTKKLSETTYLLYENPNAMPLGYTYEKTVSEKDVSKLNGIDKEETMLDTAIVEKKDSLNQTKLNKSSSTKLPYTYYTKYNEFVKFQDNKIIVNRGKTKVDLIFIGSPKKNLYVYFKNLDFAQKSELDANIDTYDALSLGEKNLISNKYNRCKQSTSKLQKR